MTIVMMFKFAYSPEIYV